MRDSLALVVCLLQVLFPGICSCYWQQVTSNECESQSEAAVKEKPATGVLCLLKSTFFPNQDFDLSFGIMWEPLHIPWRSKRETQIYQIIVTMTYPHKSMLFMKNLILLVDRIFFGIREISSEWPDDEKTATEMHP
ncbi:hypothetical protein C5167_026441 [Papaver somniferum]|nr:hypothetical protein C5167_026441 [Papaver somniferum]